MIKGAAILMMMWHHCFLKGRYEKYAISFWPLSESQVVHVASFFKICVSLFAFVSGYGLYLAYQRKKETGEKTDRWLARRLIKLLSNYWFVVVLSWIVCTAINRYPYQVYGFERSIYAGVWNMASDFFGLSNLTGAPQLNGSWWYISAAIAFIFLLPLIDAAFDKLGCLCTVGVVLLFPRMCNGYLGGIHFLDFLPIFCYGMIFAKYDIFDKWQKGWQRKRNVAAKFTLLLLILGVAYKLYYHLDTKKWWDVQLNLLPLVAILFFYTAARLIPILKSVLAFLGNHATNIWLIHTFIRYTYGEAFIYGLGHFVVIISVLFLISLCLSIAVETLKKAVRYQNLIEKVLQKI